MTFPSSTTTAHKTEKKHCSVCAVSRGTIVSRPRVFIIVYCFIACLFLLSQTTTAVAAPSATARVHFNIPRQTADDSLPAFGQQANVTVVYSFGDVSQHHTNRLYGNYTLKEGIQLLLKDSGLQAEFSADNHLIISSDGVKGEGMMRTKKNILAATIGFFMAGGVGAQEVVSQDDEMGWLLEEVVVTASKRAEGQSVQDFAGSITALSGETLKKRGFLELRDFANSLPGVTFQETGVGDQRVFIRGIALAATPNTVVARYLGELPLTTAAPGSVDIKLVDIERLEVLKGPQGTLFGSGALGGVIRYIPVAPDLNQTEGFIEVGAASRSQSDDLSHSTKAAFNAPLIEDVLALRVTAYHLEEAGWIDMVSTPTIEQIAEDSGLTPIIEDDVNNTTTSGFRASFLWQANNDLTLNLIMGRQVQETSDGVFSFRDSDYQMHRLDLGKNNRVSDIDYSNLVINYDLGWGSLTSASSYRTSRTEDNKNSTTFSNDAFFGGSHSIDSKDTDVITQELRIASNLEGPLQFVAGLYYEDIERIWPFNWIWGGDLDLMPEGFANADTPGLMLSEFENTYYDQKAFFGELSYQFNDQIKLTLGGRHFDYDRVDDIVPDESAAWVSDARSTPASKKDQNYKVNLSFTPDDNTLIYGQWSEGFRLGKGQPLPPAESCDVNNDGFLDHTGGRLVDTIEPDTTENFELGAKFTLLDNRLTLNTAIYRIDWSNIPIGFSDTTEECGNGGIVNNVGEARSEGLELELSYQASAALKLDLALAYNNAEITAVASGDSGLEVGEPLPYAPHLTANMGVEYGFELGGYPAYISSTISYMSEIVSFQRSFIPFAPGGNTAGDYINLGLRAGVEIDQWDLSLYANNLTDGDKMVVADFNNVAVLQAPRKIGFQVNYSF